MVKCPCLNCSYSVFIDGYFKHTHDDVVKNLISHIKHKHTIEEISEWLERCVVEYVLKDGDW